MITKENLEAMTLEQVQVLVEEEQAKLQTEIAKTRNAIDGYFYAVNEQEQKVEERKASLQKQVSGLETKIVAMAPMLVKATVAGDTKVFDEVQSRLADLETQKAVLNTQIKLLNGPLPRCDDAYASMKKAAAEAVEARKKYQANIEVITSFCNAQKQTIEDTLERICNGRHIAVDKYALSRAFQHYNPSDYSFERG